MDVTRENFTATLPLISKAIEEASFIAIDGEFTGLTNGSFKITAYDSPEERYLKLLSNTKDFLLVQFGMCAFCWSDELQRYKAEAFNFYIFPFQSSVPGAPDRIFSCQSSSLDFLSKQGFDFNKVFKKGIPYLRQTEEAAARSAMEGKQALRESAFKTPKRKSSSQQFSPLQGNSPSMISDQKAFDYLEDVKKKVQAFLDDEKQEEELVLESCNSYLRKLCFENLPAAFPDQILVESRIDEQTRYRHIVIVRGASTAIKLAREQQAKEREEAELQEAVGFSRVINMLSQNKKLIVGHNMLLDVIYTVQQFVHPLPSSLDEFKSLVSCVFPQVLDTKLMGSMMPFKDKMVTTALGEMNARLRQPPFAPVEIEVPGKYNLGDHEKEDDNLHEAAYDAFVTGSAFLSMVNFLSALHNPSRPVTSFSTLCNLITPYINKVFLMRSHDIPYLNLSGQDLSPSRAHVFHVGFPATWRSNDLRQLFSLVGQINISWIDESHCFIGLFNKNQSKNVKKLLDSTSVEPSTYRIRTYDEYQTAMAQGSYQSHTRNRVWQSTESSVTSQGSHGARSLFNNSDLETTCTSSSNSENSGHVTNRKRQGQEISGEGLGGDGEDNDGEPLMKKKKSQEDCPNVAKLRTSTSPKTDKTTPVAKPTQESEKFAVPDEWD